MMALEQELELAKVTAEIRICRRKVEIFEDNLSIFTNMEQLDSNQYNCQQEAKQQAEVNERIKKYQKLDALNELNKQRLEDKIKNQFLLNVQLGVASTMGIKESSTTDAIN